MNSAYLVLLFAEPFCPNCLQGYNTTCHIWKIWYCKHTVQDMRCVTEEMTRINYQGSLSNLL